MAGALRRITVAVLAVGLVGSVTGSALATPARADHSGKTGHSHLTRHERKLRHEDAVQAHAAAAVDRSNLSLAASAISAEALAGGALDLAPSTTSPAVAILQSDVAMIQAARQADPSRQPQRTTGVMGPVPYALSHELRRTPWHHFRGETRALFPFHGSVPVGSSGGWGVHAMHDGAFPAPFQRRDGVYVDPRLPALVHPTVSMVALRTALHALGQPYVWAAAGPTTFDCSGLVRWAYGHAGIALYHYTGTQWNEGRLIPPQDALPGDLLLFGRPIDHVGIYLGAGWMINAPYTGHYVDVVPVETDLDGVIRP